jgi:hypothetical protein
MRRVALHGVPTVQLPGAEKSMFQRGDDTRDATGLGGGAGGDDAGGAALAVALSAAPALAVALGDAASVGARRGADADGATGKRGAADATALDTLDTLETNGSPGEGAATLPVVTAAAADVSAAGAGFAVSLSQAGTRRSGRTASHVLPRESTVGEL